MIKSFFRARRGGKSYFAAEIAKRNPNAIIVTINQANAQVMVDRGVSKEQVVTIAQVRSGILRGRIVGPLVFDNFEYMLRDLLGIEYGIYDTDIFLTATGTNL